MGPQHSADAVNIRTKPFCIWCSTFTFCSGLTSFCKRRNKPYNGPEHAAGEALVYINPVRHANAYLFLYVPSPISNNAWCHAAGSKPWFTITGLTPGTIYSFKIGVTGTRDQVVYTDSITKMVV